MYELALILHSWLRWATIAAGLAATVAAFTSRPQVAKEVAAHRQEPTMEQPDKWGLVFMIVLDLQLLLGLLLYFAFSPTTLAIFADFGAAMRDPVARFWAVEHVSLMVFAVVMAHVGRVLARKAPTAASKRKRLLVCFTLSMVAMLVATPWPGMRAGRPLFRI